MKVMYYVHDFKQNIIINVSFSGYKSPLVLPEWSRPNQIVLKIRTCLNYEHKQYNNNINNNS